MLIPRDTVTKIASLTPSAAAIFLLLFAASISQAQDGHAEHHDMYKRWVVPGTAGSSCCDERDCRPVAAWGHGPDGYWFSVDGTTMCPVNPTAVLRGVQGDGGAHVCIVPSPTNPCAHRCFLPGIEA